MPMVSTDNKPSTAQGTEGKEKEAVDVAVQVRLNESALASRIASLILRQESLNKERNLLAETYSLKPSFEALRTRMMKALVASKA